MAAQSALNQEIAKMTAGGFQRLNTRAAKVNGEMVMWIRKCYAEMQSYPMIRAGLQSNFGVVLSIQQITRIAKGQSFAQLPVLPTNTEVELTMHSNAKRMEGFNPSQEEISASLQRTLEMLTKDSAPRRDIMDVLQNRELNVAESFMGAAPNATEDAAAAAAGDAATNYQRMLTEAQLQADNRDGSNAAEHRAMEKLQATISKHTATIVDGKPNAEKLLETLKNEPKANS